MQTQTIAIPIFYGQRKQYELLQDSNTPVSVRLRQYTITGVQGTDVGEAFALRLNNNDLVHEGFYILRDANSSSTYANPNMSKISRTRDIPLVIDASGVTSRELNRPYILTATKPISNPNLLIDPIIVKGSDGVTEPIYDKAIIVLEIDYIPTKYGTTDLNIITPAWRN